MQYLDRGSKIFILLSFGANENAFFKQIYCLFYVFCSGVSGFPDSQNKALGKNRAKLSYNSLEKVLGPYHVN